MGIPWSAVRVAEWSKAPDSRANLARYAGSEPSGPRMWAWVRIPPLTLFFFFSLTYIHFFYISRLFMQLLKSKIFFPGQKGVSEGDGSTNGGEGAK